MKNKDQGGKDTSQNIWEKIRHRLLNEMPEIRDDSDWAAMEGLLDEEPGFFRSWKMILLSLFILILGIGLLNNVVWNSNNQTDLTEVATKPTLPSEEIKETTEKNIKEDSTALDFHTKEAGESVRIEKNFEKEKERPSESTHSTANQDTNKLKHLSSTLQGRKNSNQGNGLDFKKEGSLSRSKLLEGKNRSVELEDLNKALEISNPYLSEKETIKTTNLLQQNTEAIIPSEPILDWTSFDPLDLLAIEELKIEKDSFSLTNIIPEKPKYNKFDFGVLFGPNLSIVEAPTRNTARSMIGGFFAKFNFSRRWSVQLDANYKKLNNLDVSFTKIDTFYNEENGSSFYTQTRHREVTSLSMVELSLVTKYKALPRVSYALGFRTSYAFGSRGVDSRVFSGGPQWEFTPSQGYWKTSYAIIIGLQYRLSQDWEVDFRFNQGLLDITPDNLYNDDATHLNSDLQCTFRYYFEK